MTTRTVLGEFGTTPKDGGMMVTANPQKMSFSAAPVDVDSLFGLSKPTVQGLAAKDVQSDLKLLNLHWSGNATSPFTAEDMKHSRTIMDRYTQDHPLGFLAKTSPIIAQSMMTDALRNDVEKNMDAYNAASGNFKDADAFISKLRNADSAEFAATTQTAFNAVHRGILVEAARDLRAKAKLSDDGLWGTSAPDEHQMRQQFRASAAALDNAIVLFDQGKTDEAMTQFNSVMEDAGGYESWFGRALKHSEHKKFAAHIGVTLAAALASGGVGSFVTGSMLGGARATNLGWKILTFSTASLASGTTFAMTSRALDQAVFKTPFLHKDTAYDNIMDLSAESIKMSLLMGWMHGVGKVAEGLPKLSADMAAVGWTRSFAVEYTGLTAFNVASAYGDHLIDPTLPGADQVLTKEALIESGFFLLGLKGGSAVVRNAPQTMRWTAAQLSKLGPVRAFSARFPTLSPSARAVLLSPLTFIMGVPQGSGIGQWTGKRPPIGDGLKSLNTYFEALGTDPAMARLYDMFLVENWLVLTALAATRLGIPKTTTAMKISGGSFDGSHSLFASIDHLLQETAVQSDADFILKRGLAKYYGNSNVRANMDPFVRMAVDSLFTSTRVTPPIVMPNPIQASQLFLDAAIKMQALISQTSAAIATRQFIIGTKPGPFTLGNEIEVAAADYNPDPPTNDLQLDQMMHTLEAALLRKGYRVRIDTAEAHEAVFTAKVMDLNNPGTLPYPFVYDYFSTSGRYFIAETYRGTGAYMITLKEIDPTTRAVLSSQTKHLQHVRDENGGIFLDAQGKPVLISNVKDCRIPILQLLGNKLGFENPVSDVNAAIAQKTITTRIGFLLLVKGTDGDIIKIKVDVNYDTHIATLTPLNGRFTNPKLGKIFNSGFVRSDDNPVGKVMEILSRELRDRISGRVFAQKHDHIKNMNISRPGTSEGSVDIHIINEAHPFAELVSGIMTPDVIDIWQGAVETMTELGWKGTVDDRLIGRHVHVGVAGKTPEGQWTMKPLTLLTRALPEWVSHFKELFPSNGNRAAFNQDQSKAVVDFFNSPHLDPQNPDHILMTGMMIAGFNPQKYMGFNPDNIVSKVLRHMIADGTFEMNSTREVVWEGQTYKFSIKGMTREAAIRHLVSEGTPVEELKSKDIDAEEYHSYDIEGTLPDGRTMSLMRVPASADKWTWEVRFPDTVMDGAHDAFLMRSVMAFMYQYGHAPLYQTPLQ